MNKALKLIFSLLLTISYSLSASPLLLKAIRNSDYNSFNKELANIKLDRSSKLLYLRLAKELVHRRYEIYRAYPPANTPLINLSWQGPLGIVILGSGSALMFLALMI